jgi:ribonucleoside-diphosphate reductase alpha chain
LSKKTIHHQLTKKGKKMEVVKRNGEMQPLAIDKIHKAIEYASKGLDVSLSEIETGAHLQFFNGIKTSQIQTAMINSAASLIDIGKTDYEFAAARLLLQQIYKEVTQSNEYPTLESYIEKSVRDNKLKAEMLTFDLNMLDAVIDTSRDNLFKYLGMQTIYDRYLIRDSGKKVIEMPQHFWMRVAMGLALNETPETRTNWAIEFYNVLSRFEFVSSTPTLFNSGTPFSQMSSCFVTTVDDSIWEEQEGVNFGKGIFATMTECALYSKFAGGIGTDWTRVRPAGAEIDSTNGMSSGSIPYLKVFNDTAVSVNQGGKRNGSFAAYLEPWHGDIERFISLKKPQGDERLRAREIFPYLWINDLFMERVKNREQWSLFCSHKNPELCETYGEEFKRAYLAAEERGDAIKVIDAMELWRHTITALVESGAPLMTFKDEHNRRNPQDHVGIIRSSNLCSEISLNTSDTESAVCNLGSINVSVCHPSEFRRVVPIAMRMLDNVIDLNFYPTEKARRSNLKSRPVGLGLMGWTDYIVSEGIDWESNEHLKRSDFVFECLSYWAIRSSMNLAIEKGRYETFEGSKWSKGILPIDTARELPKEWLDSNNGTFEWSSLREAVKKHGMRNSNCMAIAPTATIANIVGTTACIEPIYKQVFVKENKSGKFKVVDPAMRHNSPELCKTAFEIDQTWLIKAAAVRQQWIDQSQSVNLFKKADVKGNVISDWYFLAWELGLKSTYYLKQQINELVFKDTVIPEIEPVVMCSIDNPDCESCQ